MEKFLNRFKYMLNIVGRIELCLASICVLSILVFIFIQVVARSVFGIPIIWTDELGIYSFVWLTFLGASIGFKLMRHIVIQSFVSKLPTKIQDSFRVIIYILVLILAVVLYQEVSTTVLMESRSYSVALPIKIPRAWFFSIPLKISMAMTTISCFYYVLAGVYGTIKGEEVKPIMDDGFLKEEVES